MALALALLALAGLVFIAVLLADGVRVLLARRRSEAAGQLVRHTLARAKGGHQPAFAAATGTATTGQRITLDRDGHKHELTTAGEPTLLATLEAHDLAPPSVCRAGRCGECRMQLIDGEVRWLMQPEIAVNDGLILPCICAAVGDINIQ